MKEKPLARRNYKLPRKVVHLKTDQLVPECGGWFFGSELTARAAAKLPRRPIKRFYPVGTFCWREGWWVLDCGEVPETNEWGEVSL